MQVPDRNLNELREQGFTIVPGFLAPEELNAAQEALWEQHVHPCGYECLGYPRPADYFADPSAHQEYAASQFAGSRMAPWQSWDLNRLAFHPDLVDLAERFLGSADLHLYDADLWAKYAGAVDYEQPHHRDFINHTLVVPKRDDPGRQLRSYILLSDIDEHDGPTKVVPLAAGAARPYWPTDKLHGWENFAGGTGIELGAFADVEVSVTGPAGSLFAFRTDVLHRASNMTGIRRARFLLEVNYEVWGPRWTGRTQWPVHSQNPHWTEMMERATPRERELFGFPSIGDPYWDDQTLADVQCRYPSMDMASYADPVSR
jgi:phytanoyl-CoA dioxygenase PhyH